MSLMPRFLDDKKFLSEDNNTCVIFFFWEWPENGLKHLDSLETSMDGS